MIEIRTKVAKTAEVRTPMALLLKRYRAARRIGSVHPTGLLKIAGICGKPTETPPAIVRTVLLELELAGRVERHRDGSVSTA